MMYHTNFPMKERYSVCKEVIKFATLIDGDVVVEIDG